VPGERAAGGRRAAATDFYFDGHFPGEPIVPAIVLVEMLAQVGGLAAGAPAAGASVGGASVAGAPVAGAPGAGAPGAGAPGAGASGAGASGAGAPGAGASGTGASGTGAPGAGAPAAPLRLRVAALGPFKFPGAARPGAWLEARARVAGRLGGIYKIEGEVTADGQVVASGSVTLATV
jgi:3-hydroxymyristoyl/3-hydroxydecanoyl-(acyl carrier protein) dehydratase